LTFWEEVDTLLQMAEKISLDETDDEEEDVDDDFADEPAHEHSDSSEKDDTHDDGDGTPGTSHGEVDISAGTFPEVKRRFASEPHKFFDDPNYYKTALGNEGDIAQRVHTLLGKYLNTKDPKDRSVFRPQIISAYWEFLRGVAKKAPGKLIPPKKFLLRYGLLHPNFIKPETKEFLSTLITDDELGQPVYYADEWFKGVGNGSIRASTTDEVNIARSNTQMKIQQLLEKAVGKASGFRTLVRGKSQERVDSEKKLNDQIRVVTEHFPMDDFEGVSSSYSESQKRTFADVQETIRNLLKVDRELVSLLKEFHQAEDDVRSLHDKVEEGGQETLDLQAVDSEFDTVRQTAKMTIGRQGNHFPILTNEYFHCGPNDVGFRENIISMLAKVESIDAEAFYRYYRNKLNRIVPYVVLIPTYGDSGVCWEPFDKHNRATSRGRMLIPMYPKNLFIAVLSAVADHRWQVAKEKASYYWMEEGLTGNYYQWFAAQKIKGNIKDYFIQDYILWMTKEADGIQKLDKEVRGAFWRFMPFTAEVKDKLKTRSYVYQELCQRDANRAMSDGY
jgi:hypothetical protein